ncbi:MAG: restriction endonuclease [Oscillospiraceae bacterium]|nr:restriction endonuclease [Oscillospiraceae bacterium]
MSDRKYTTKEEVLVRGREAIGIPLRDMDKTHKLSIGKGAVGSVVEESWFGYKINSDSEPDFAEAGVELKVTPYVKASKGVRAKERLVCNIINYMEEYKNTFQTSSFWRKCNTMLIMAYRHIDGVDKGDFTIEEAILFSFPVEDLIIIEKDWEYIISKIRAGRAHEISEGDTLYLGACTKGATSASVRQQPFSDIPAKQRAYSLKQSYMTYILNNYIFGERTDEHIVKDPALLREKSFEEYIVERIAPYFGRSRTKLMHEFDIQPGPKNINEIILARILGIEGKITATDEFQKANIIPKTIRIQKTGHIRESMSFPGFRFLDIIQEDWEDSSLKNYLEPTKFLFIIFKENDAGDYFFERVKFWNMPAEDLDEVRKVWERTVQVIRYGVELEYNGSVTRNNLPKQSENRVAHVRPHAKNASDTYPLPDGRDMIKQCFWLNSTYVESIINE